VIALARCPMCHVAGSHKKSPIALSPFRRRCLAHARWRVTRSIRSTSTSRSVRRVTVRGCALSLSVATCPALLISCVRTDGHVAGYDTRHAALECQPRAPRGARSVLPAAKPLATYSFRASFLGKSIVCPDRLRTDTRKAHQNKMLYAGTVHRAWPIWDPETVVRKTAACSQCPESTCRDRLGTNIRVELTQIDLPNGASCRLWRRLPLACTRDRGPQPRAAGGA
jgi:hypothetical protein